jgi:hypothetical protein
MTPGVELPCDPQGFRAERRPALLTKALALPGLAQSMVDCPDH